MTKDITPQAPRTTEPRGSEARDAKRDAGRKTLGWKIPRKTGRKTNARGFSDVQLKERVVPVVWA